MTAPPPAHLVVAGTERHGVTLLASQLAGATGAPRVADLDAAAGHDRVHVHATDRLLGSSPEQAATALAGLARRTRVTLTLHDVPQPSDGSGFRRRRACYAAWLGDVGGWVVSSETERALVEAHCEPPTPGVVVALPVWPPRAGLPGLPSGPLAPGDASIAVFGWVYPGKGHVDALAAAALLGSTPQTRPRVQAVGALATGHDALGDDLARLADDLGVRFSITGWLDDEAAHRALAAATVGLSGHLNVSASGSIGSWLAAGRRPLVRDGAYVREIAALRPATVEPYPADATPADLAALVARRLDDPSLGVVDAAAAVRPTLAEVAAAYRRWWG